MDWIIMHETLRSIGSELLEKTGGRKSRTMGVGIYVRHLGVSLIGFHRGRIWQSPSSGVSFLYCPQNSTQGTPSGPAQNKRSCLYRLLDLEQSLFLAEHCSLLLSDCSSGRYVHPSMLRRALRQRSGETDMASPSSLAYQVYEYLREAGYVVRRLPELRVRPPPQGHWLADALLLPTLSSIPQRISHQDWWWSVQHPAGVASGHSSVLATVVKADEATLPRLAVFYQGFMDGGSLHSDDTFKTVAEDRGPEDWTHVDRTVGPSHTVVVTENAKLVFLRIQELQL
eukprot:GHVS01076512.1.p2 GENE.GHVS01076512.1~~GHVS01076512.1.p2  ORF type:complete len:284 (-),score=19.86 GHVS01076512.1:1619-2470(-)